MRQHFYERFPRPLVAVLAVVFGAASPLAQADDRSTIEAVSRPDRDDAALRDVFFTSPQRGFAVGDRGTILCTDDGGQTWSQLASDTEANLRSVSFISEAEGWIAGGGTREYSGSSFGVVLATEDGGETWNVVCDQKLPGVYRIQFFSDVEGIAVGDATDQRSTGLHSTTDGGRTWSPIPGDPTNCWRTAEFASSKFALLAGEKGTFGSLANGQVTNSTPLGGLRGIKASSLDRPAKTMWAVGDGGLVVRSSDGGASWPAADSTMPAESKMVFDFTAVAALKDEVWVGGTPGSVIWHSPDGGASWQAEPTTETTPIYAIRCLPGGKRVAVGALGKILVREGDTPWTTVRGAGRRLAALAIHAHGSRLSLLQLGRDGMDRGYRIGAWSLVRRDIELGADRPADGSRRFEDAALSLTAACGTTDWRLPVSLPGLDRNPQALMAEWSVLADQKLNDVLVATLVTQIRTWRPDVLLLDDAPADDMPTQVIHAALPVVLNNAQANRGRMTALWTAASLPEWNVKRVYSRSPAGREGEATVDPFEWVSQLQTSLTTIVGPAASRMGKSLETLSQRETFHSIDVPGLPGSQPKEFFAGLSLSAGGDARRSLPIPGTEDAETLLQMTMRQRNFQKMSQKLLGRPGQAEILLGQLHATLEGMPVDQAAITLAMLGDDLRQRADWDAAESTLLELVTRYPAHPAAREARRWLITLWASGEVEYHRGRSTAVSQATVEQASGTNAAGPKPVTLAGGSVFVGDVASVLGAGARAINAEGPQGSMTGRRRLDADKRFAQARQLLDDWKKIAPDDVDATELQLQLAALYRRHDKHQEAEAIYTQLVQNTSGAGRRVAHGELWLLRPSTQSLQTVYRANRTSRPPLLDGVLSDDCWQAAKELRIAGPSKAVQKVDDELAALDVAPTRDLTGSAFCMIAYDGAYLYLAASAPRHPSVPKTAPSYAGRPYDADLDAFDRLSFALDLNRDYQTAYRFDIDQRGWTRDAMWTNQGWNPKWHVACDADESNWRIEAAINWSELSPQPPAPGAVIALGVTRTIPAVGRQSWVWPASDPIASESMGLLMLE